MPAEAGMTGKINRTKFSASAHLQICTFAHHQISKFSNHQISLTFALLKIIQKK
jgi:hypothetical protein